MDSEVLWKPSLDHFKNSELYKFIQFIKDRENNGKNLKSIDFPNYETLWKWSVREKEKFWNYLWNFCEVIGEKGNLVLKNKDSFIDSQWFPEGRINYAENILNRIPFVKSPNQSIIFWGEDKVEIIFTIEEFKNLVSRIVQALKAEGLKPGDRVAAMVPNHPHSLAFMLATTALGGIWTSCSPDFGVQGVLDRFSQVQPQFFLACDGYYYNGKTLPTLEKVKEVSKSLPSVKKVIVIEYIEASHSTSHDKVLNENNENVEFVTITKFLEKFPTPIKIEYTRVNFNHPLFIMYSSGTTGVPKCIIHGHGGTLLQHLKEHRLHCDLKPQDKLFYFTTCGWMMWNWLVSGLATGANLLLFDGSPTYKKDPNKENMILFEFAEKFLCTHFGTSAKFIDACMKAQLRPQKNHQLNSLKMVLSTGSPLSAEGFDYVYHYIGKELQLASISGGTDILSCFVLGSPWSPVYRGEISVAGLGMDVDVWNEFGASISCEKGELVCKSSFPSKPLGFWNDVENKKFSAAYFEKFKNTWCHGDYVEKTSHQGFIIYGRSDATLNPGGVRIGTAEIYRQVEQLEEVLESIVVGQNWQNDVRVVLFVKLKASLNLNEDLILKIKNQIRKNTTPRHVPALILQVNDIPRTKSGKIVELAVRQTIHHEKIQNLEALANPEALNEFKNRAELD